MECVSLSIRFAKRLLQLRAEGFLVLRRHLQYEMQGKPVHLDGGRKGVNAVHDFEALHYFDQLDSHVRPNDWDVMGSKKTSRARLVDIIYQAGNGLDGSRAGTDRKSV